MATATVSALLRANQAYYAQLSETCSLEHWGIAFSAKGREQATVAEANQFREVIIEDGSEFERVFSAVETYFGELGLSCFIWAPAADADDDALAEFLGRRGFRRREMLAMTVREWVDSDVDAGVRLLPARAMRRGLQVVHEERFAAAGTKQRNNLIGAVIERLNDPRMDAFVAVVEDKPAGYGALFQIGDVGRICDVYITPEFRRRGVGRALVGQMLRLARRLCLRAVCAPVESYNAAGLALYGSSGLVPDGSVVEFVAADCGALHP